MKMTALAIILLGACNLFAQNKTYEPMMVKVEGGTFMMGSSDSTDAYYAYEKPAHTVSLNTFYIGKFEVTQWQWITVMGNNPSINCPYEKDCPTCPVVEVGYDDVQEYLTKLNKLTGKQYRLPTEMEWEYAARGGNRSKGYVYAGSNNPKEVAWFDHDGSHTWHTHPVGKLKPNELGLYDMSGNANEWTSSKYVNLKGGMDYELDSTYKGLRGGSYSTAFPNCRTKFRNYANQAHFGSQSEGFRIALSE